MNPAYHIGHNSYLTFIFRFVFFIGTCFALMGGCDNNPQWRQFHGGEENQGYIAAHTKNTLEPKWSNPFHIGNISYSSPAIGEDGTIYIGTTSGALVAVKNDGTDFKRIFHTDLKFGN